FYTALKRREEITDLIFIQGLDLPLSGGNELRRRSSQMAHEVAATLGKRLIEVKADTRCFSDRYVHYAYHYGSALAAIALLFQHRFRAVLVPAGQSYAHLHRDGSHPLLDPLWSTGRTQIVTDGAEARRTEKVESIASWELAMRWLRVCLENPDGVYNCGRCEKCLRTRINLRAVGAEGRCRTLPRHLDLRQVRRLNFLEERHRDYALDSLHAVEARGNDPKLARALRVALGANLLRSALKTVAPAWARDAAQASRPRLRSRNEA
ncbi:MAG: hypothetical protein ACRDKX_04870, partial [Solirubrobacterales bacterium]